MLQTNLQDKRYIKLPEITLRKKKQKAIPIQLKEPSESVSYIRNIYKDDIELYESAYIVMLNTVNQVIGYAKISQGSLNATVIDIRLIALYCVLANARSCIFAHNHPSGGLLPSEEDKRLTERLSKALGLFDIKLLDSIIITSDSYSHILF